MGSLEHFETHAIGWWSIELAKLYVDHCHMEGAERDAAVDRTWQFIVAHFTFEQLKLLRTIRPETAIEQIVKKIEKAYRR